MDGRQIRFLGIFDRHTRLCSSIKSSRSRSEDAIDSLAELFAMQDVPKQVRCDNGQEFIATAIKNCLGKLGVGTPCAEPGLSCRLGSARASTASFAMFTSIRRSCSMKATRRLKLALGMKISTVIVGTVRWGAWAPSESLRCRTASVERSQRAERNKHSDTPQMLTVTLPLRL